MRHEAAQFGTRGEGKRHARLVARGKGKQGRRWDQNDVDKPHWMASFLTRLGDIGVHQEGTKTWGAHQLAGMVPSAGNERGGEVQDRDEEVEVWVDKAAVLELQGAVLGFREDKKSSDYLSGDSTTSGGCGTAVADKDS
ncbi:hypothetical protein E2562_024754 [Oryza meyeriana var. granulata]|uniref:Uncharacterized protein n=1 Tax=Oryza meyeriana var. granulata TaxID=110450 RepID=A0A6G1D7G8_9ORYZ|nr:hypothetical protein E2562_024754 [Oryza meyeriana var. granulata]